LEREREREYEIISRGNEIGVYNLYKKRKRKKEIGVYRRVVVELIV
jgi:hypothetical protein